MENEKLLEFIQITISRLSNQSFLIKGWTVTLLSALLFFSKGNPEAKYNLMFAFMVIAFQGLDASYLKQERIYRLHFKNILKNDNSINMDMDVSYLHNSIKFLKCLFSRINLIFYGSLLIFLLVFTCLI